MNLFISQLEEGAVKELLERTTLKGTALIRVGAQCYIENMNEEAERLTGLHPMSKIDEVLSNGAYAALKDCVERGASHTVHEELDNNLYELEIVPHNKGALLAYIRCDRSVYDGSLRIVQSKGAKYIGALLGITGKLEDKEKAAELRRQCLRLMRMLSHSDFLHEQPAPEQINLKPQDIGLLCRYAVEAAKKHTGRKIKLTVPEMCMALVDARLLKIALYNLLSNAISVTPETESVELEVADVSEFITLTVSDRGKGLDPAAFDILLSGWQRTVSYYEYRCLAKECTPLGFGLPLIKSIAQLHGGSLLLSQREGGGSELHMTISKNLGIVDTCSELHMPDVIEDAYSLDDIEFSIF